MAYNGLADFISVLEEKREIIRIKNYVDPVLEITDVADRVSKNNGKALLFENNGTDFPLLINIFGSEKRLSIAFSRTDTDSVAGEITNLLDLPEGGILKKIVSAGKISRILPAKSGRKGKCQQIINMNPDLGMLPVLKCWPYDGGRFITLPMVHTIHPETGKTNVGMYRMQILDEKSTALHWQLHKTGARHFEEWKKRGLRMPVSVALGGDPVYSYAATAPLPENIDEYLLAGFIRKQKVKLVRCITNNLWVPDDADIILEGYVDSLEEPVTEGPFGDHTGFYSLSDKYPVFHVTCITHSRKAVYPATIVGIPPCEDAMLIRATEKIFLPALRITMQPELLDLHMPDAGVAHNLVIVKIKKTYPGQGRKIIHSLYGSGQLMLTKYVVVVSGDVDIRNYPLLLKYILDHTDFRNDLHFNSGPLDVLDHSSDAFAFGSKLGIDATEKLPGEIPEGLSYDFSFSETGISRFKEKITKDYSNIFIADHLGMAVIGLNQRGNPAECTILKEYLQNYLKDNFFRLILAVDHNVDVSDLFMVAWQVFGNTDPDRDIVFVSDNTLFIDGTLKCFSTKPFLRRWPNIVCSSSETISIVDKKWKSLGIGEFLPSPSMRYTRMSAYGRDEIVYRSI